MAFKSMEQFNEEKYGNFLILPNDNDYADVIFLYRSKADVLMADVHWIKSDSYSGYAHCCGAGCPACAYPTKDGKGIRLDNKLFIPLYNVTAGKIQFWDRSTRFDVQLARDVFDRFPNPSEYVFRITRHGEAGDRNTRYEIKAVGKNTSMPYDKVLADFNVQLPDYYSTVVKEMSIAEMSLLLSTPAESAMTAVPRDAYVPAPSMTIPAPQIANNFDVPADIPDLELPPIFNPQPDEAAVPETSDEVSAAESVDGGENADVDNVSF